MKFRSNSQWKFLVGAVALTFFSGCSSDPEPGPDGGGKKEDARVVSFAAAPATVLAGEVVTLSWVTEHATSVKIFDGASEIPLGDEAPEAGTAEVTVTQSTTYELVAVGSSGTEAREVVEVKVRLPDEPGIENFEADAVSITHGESTTLRWKVVDATQLTLLAGDEILVDGSADLEGELLVSPLATTLYKLVAVGAEAEASATLEIAVAPKVLRFEAEPEVVTAGPGNPAEVVLAWQIEGAESLEIRGPDGALDVSGEDTGFGQVETTVEATSTFTLVAHGAGGAQTTLTTEVRVVGMPTILSFTAPELVGGSEVFFVQWETANAVRVELQRDGSAMEINPFEGSGSLEQSLEGSATYRLIAYNQAGETVEEELLVSVGEPEILEFSSDASRVAPGTQARLSWKTVGGSALTLVDAEETVLFSSADADEIREGSFEVTSSSSAAYQAFALRITNASGSASAEAGFGVGNGPLIRSFVATPELVSLGDEVLFTWVVEDDAEGGTPVLVLVDDTGHTYDISEIVGEEGSASFAMAVAGSRTFTLSASSPAGSMEAVSVVEVADRPTITLLASPEAYDPSAGGKVLLEWTSTGGVSLDITEVNASGGIRKIVGSITPSRIAAGSEETVPFNLPVTYRAVVTNALGATAETSVEVVRADTVVTFTATPDTVTGRQPVTLSWDVEGASQVSLEPVFLGGTLEPFMDVRTLPGAVEAGIGSYECFVDFEDRNDQGCVWIDFPAGFEFPFGGGVKTGARAYINGFIGFDYVGNSSTNTNFDLPNSQWAGFVSLAPFWDDLERNPSWEGSSRNGSILHYFGTDSRGDFLVIQWSRMWIKNSYDDSPSDINFQVILWEDGGFDYRYGTMVATGIRAGREAGDSATIGFQTDPNTATVVSHNVLIPGGLQNFGFRFAPADLPASGSIEVVPLGPTLGTGTTTYTLTAEGADEPITETATVTVQ